MKNALSAVVLGVTIVLAACRTEGSVDPATPQNGPRRGLASSEAAAQIAAVRCEHESACNNVGQGRPYATPETCASLLQESAAAELAPGACPLGVDPRQLESCATQFRRESCHPLATLGRMTACAPASLCLRPRGESFSAEDAYGVQ